MRPAPLLPDSSVRIIDEFIESVLRRVGWRVGRAWWRVEDRFDCSSWVALGLETDVLGSGTETPVAGAQTPLDGERRRFLEPTLLAVADSDVGDGDREVLNALGADRVLVIDVGSDHLVDVRLLLAPPPGTEVTRDQIDSVRAAIQLVPTVFLQERSNRELGLRAHHDPLTGLLNRRGWERLLAIRTGTVVAGVLLFIDLDGFKSINDRFGHRVGDEVLTAVARSLTSTVRPNDVVARIGGDEFVVFAADVHDEETALAAATRIVRHVNRDVLTAAGRIVAVSGSTGAALWRAGDDPADAIAEADRLMYEAKRLGGGVATRSADGALRVVDVVTGHDLHGENDPWLITPVTVRLRRGVEGHLVAALVVLAPTLANTPAADQASAVLAALASAGVPEGTRIELLVRGSGWTRLNRLSALVTSLISVIDDHEQLAVVIPADTRDADVRVAVDEVSRELSLQRSVAVSRISGSDLGALLLENIDAVYLGPKWSRSADPIVGEHAALDGVIALTLALGQSLVLVDGHIAQLVEADAPGVEIASTPDIKGNRS